MTTIPTPAAAAASAQAPPLAIGLRQLVIVGAALALFWIVVFNPRALNDGDTYWHLASGAWMLDHRQVPHADPFSFTPFGQPWGAHEWLSGAQEHPGSWWSDWMDWLGKHAGQKRAAPGTFGNAHYQAIEPAPGRYVKQRA